MALKHTPAWTVSYPDSFEDTETGVLYYVSQDEAPENPLSLLAASDAALWAFREPSLSSSVLADKPEGNPAVDAFAAYLLNHEPDRAKKMAERYLSVFHPEDGWRIATATVRGSSQSDWLEVFAATRIGIYLDSLIETARQWAFGEVWYVEAEYPDGTVKSMGGIYADSPESALSYWRKTYEEKPLRRFRHTVELIVERADETTSTSVVEQIVHAIHESDALPEGVTVASYTEAEPEETTEGE